MANAATIRVMGAKELDRKLKRLDKAAARKIGKKATRAGAKIVHSAVKAAAVKGPTGNLKKGIKIKVGRMRGGSAMTRVIAVAPHSHLVEKGTVPRFRKAGRWGRLILQKGAPTGTMPARPFFDPAAMSVSGAAVNAMQTEAIKLVNEAFKG